MKNCSEPLFVFAYGSLIWRPDFQYTSVHQAVVHGYERRFWQASHDHRGTPDQPGRVVTLVPVIEGWCEGLIYRLPDEQQDEILAMLDEREQDGYERTWLQAVTNEHAESVKVLTWLASPGNPSWAGDTALGDLAQLISDRAGPSGSNLDYLLRLHSGLKELGINDSHVTSVVRELGTRPD